MAFLGVKREADTRTITLDSLADVATEWLPAEVRSFATKVALEENRGQVIQGNFPTRVVVDKRTTVNLTRSDAKELARAAAANNVRFIGLDRNIRFFYSDNQILDRALRYSWNLLLQLTRVGAKSPHAINTYYIWCSDPDNRGRSRKCTTVDEAIRWLAESNGPLINVRILGPTAEYRRELIYNPRGRKQQTRWATTKNSAYTEGRGIDRYRFTNRTKSKIHEGRETSRIAIRSSRRKQSGYRVQVAKAIQEIVAKNTQRQFRDLLVGYRFTRSKEPLPYLNSKTWRPDGENIHIPELSLAVRTRNRRR